MATLTMRAGKGSALTHAAVTYNYNTRPSLEVFLERDTGGGVRHLT